MFFFDPRDVLPLLQAPNTRYRCQPRSQATPRVVVNGSVLGYLP